MAYETPDSSLAAFLTTLGYEVQSVRLAGNSCVFAFADAATQDVDGYFRNAALPARQYAAALRAIRALVARTKSSSTFPHSYEVPNDSRPRSK